MDDRHAIIRARAISSVQDSCSSLYQGSESSTPKLPPQMDTPSTATCETSVSQTSTSMRLLAAGGSCPMPCGAMSMEDTSTACTLMRLGNAAFAGNDVRLLQRLEMAGLFKEPSIPSLTLHRISTSATLSSSRSLIGVSPSIDSQDFQALVEESGCAPSGLLAAYLHNLRIVDVPPPASAASASASGRPPDQYPAGGASEGSITASAPECPPAITRRRKLLEEMIKVAELGPGYTSTLLTPRTRTSGSGQGSNGKASARQQGPSNSAQAPSHQLSRSASQQGARKSSSQLQRTAWTLQQQQQQYSPPNFPLNLTAHTSFCPPSWGVAEIPSTVFVPPLVGITPSHMDVWDYYASTLPNLGQAGSNMPLLQQQGSFQAEMAVALMMASSPTPAFGSNTLGWS